SPLAAAADIDVDSSRQTRMRAREKKAFPSDMDNQSHPRLAAPRPGMRPAGGQDGRISLHNSDYQEYWPGRARPAPGRKCLGPLGWAPSYKLMPAEFFSQPGGGNMDYTLP